MTSGALRLVLVFDSAWPTESENSSPTKKAVAKITTLKQLHVMISPSLVFARKRNLVTLLNRLDHTTPYRMGESNALAELLNP
jgi:hypothetical protein